MSYQILAYSPSTNQTQQEIELNGNQIVSEIKAQQRADAFANLLNTQQKLHVADWQGKIEFNDRPASSWQ